MNDNNSNNNPSGPEAPPVAIAPAAAETAAVAAPTAAAQPARTERGTATDGLAAAGAPARAGHGTATTDLAPAVNNISIAPTGRWCANPMTADFDPGTPQGQKIFESKTRGVPEERKFEVKSNEGAVIRKFLMGKQGSLGGVITNIPLEYHPNGTVKTSGNLIKQYQCIKFETMRREAYKRFVGELDPDAPLPPGPWTLTPLDPERNFNDRTRFYSQVHANVVHQLLINILTSTGYSKIIQGREDQISFHCPQTGSIIVDGPALLHLLWQKVDPSLTVNVETLRAQIETTKLHKFGNDVDAMLTDIEETFQRIQNMNATCESIVRYTLNACLSGPCDEFNSFIKGIKGDVDGCIATHANISFHNLVAAARNKFLNMTAAGEYNKIDTKTTQLMTLTTKFEELQKRLNNNSSANTTSGDSSQRGGTTTPSTPGLDRQKIAGTVVEKWRITKRGASIVVDGITYWWCEKHIDKSGRWNGMYVRHKPEDHDEVMARRYRNRKPEGQNGAAGAPATSGNNLVVSQKLKEVLCGKLMISDEDADNICKDVYGQGKD